MPIKHRILKREQISSELKSLFDYPLTVVVAAMGYGKTTTVRDFLDEEKARYVWLSVESDQTSAQHIWNSLTRQLAKTQPELGKQLNVLGFPLDAPQRDKIISIMADYTYLSDTVMVIDDYHFARSPELDRMIEKIVWTNIRGLHVLIISRTKPAINIEELSLKGYCYLFNSDLFEMTEEEIKKYFKLFGHEITMDMAEKAHHISEGWITAVYLIIQRYSKTGRLEPGKSIESLIETAVMSRYTYKEVQLLKSLCILDSFTLPQVSYITGDAAAPGIIQRLSAGNSFIRYDERADNYRMHNIFSEYLKKRLTEQGDSAEIKKLFKRSGQWYIENGDIFSGLSFFLKAEEYDLILIEFEKHGATTELDKAPQLIVEIFSQIPDAVKYRHPLGYITYAYNYLVCVDMEGGAGLLAQIEEYYQNDESISEAPRQRIAGEIELARSFLFFNDLEKMHESQLKAYRLLEGSSSIANKDMMFTFGSPHTLYLYYREKGKLLWIVDYLDIIFPYYCEVSNGCGTGFEYLARAEYYLETANFEQAEHYAHKAIYKAQPMEQTSIIICATLTLARVYAAQGKFSKAAEFMDELTGEVAMYNNPVYNSALDLCTGYLGCITCRPQGFAPWLKAGDLKQSDILYQGMGFNYIVHAQAVLLEKNYLKLEVLCERMWQVFSMFNNLLGCLHTHILDAAAKYRLHGMEKAKAALQPALKIGWADDIVLPFAEYGLHILDVLRALQREEKDDAYLARIAVAAEKYCTNLKRFKDAKTSALSLTKREREVLELLVEGKTNREIAAELFIAEVTVSKNITSIYRKVGVTGRPSAVKKVMELKIL
jgi:LuxR family maltose regulon positive regulatory protein